MESVYVICNENVPKDSDVLLRFVTSVLDFENLCHTVRPMEKSDDFVVQSYRNILKEHGEKTDGYLEVRITDRKLPDRARTALTVYAEVTDLKVPAILES